MKYLRRIFIKLSTEHSWFSLVSPDWWIWSTRLLCYIVAVISEVSIGAIKNPTEWRICAPVKYSIIDLDNGVSPDRCQAIIWTNDDLILSVGVLGRKFNEIWIKIYRLNIIYLNLAHITLMTSWSKPETHHCNLKRTDMITIKLCIYQMSTSVLVWPIFCCDQIDIREYVNISWSKVQFKQNISGTYAWSLVSMLRPKQTDTVNIK